MGEEYITHIILKFIGFMSPFLLACLGIWWKVENKQDLKLELYRQSNDATHDKLRTEIISGHNMLRSEISEVHKRVDHIITNSRMTPYSNGKG